ncbi:MAG TPA: ACT domain-containing protein [Candidatus Obscuribacter sp.]|nr:hypothetical protein [Candidatus Obscuribacter sp.]MBK9276748.1 hypothetical protein [Candidatus Obscuribacter sp.]MBL8082113.1 hypothetical protein [Candidatus Obscuribacter sp.]HMW93065.1 ACT domain-containing protein [Candidatus Obscuribacter sp.]HMX47028.1 ACT domain-containing protein [Candidatus Obscuribacter sp.]
MRTQLLVTAFGEDRPGIVARLTEVVSGHGGNLEASRMSLLGGEFAAISLVTVPEHRSNELQGALTALSKEGLTVLFKVTKASQDRFAGHSFYTIHLTGADHEGIVHRLSSHLKEAKINIQRVDTEVVNAPHTGSPLFTMHAEIAVPAAIAYDALAKDLAAIAEELSVEIDLVSSATFKADLVEA